MAQNAFTVTPPNPTPPTNLSYVGNTPPLDPAQPYVDDGIPAAIPNSRLLTPANANTRHMTTSSRTTTTTQRRTGLSCTSLFQASPITHATAGNSRSRK